jgi:hypothetical protein
LREAPGEVYIAGAVSPPAGFAQFSRPDRTDVVPAAPMAGDGIPLLRE